MGRCGNKRRKEEPKDWVALVDADTRVAASPKQNRSTPLRRTTELPAANDRTSFPEGEYRFRGVGAGNDKLAPQHRYSAKNQNSHTVMTLQALMPG